MVEHVGATNQSGDGDLSHERRAAMAPFWSPAALSRIRRRGGLLLALAACVLGVVASVGPAPQQYVIDIGPISLPANGGHEDIEQPPPRALELPVDGWLRGLAFELVDEQGEQLPTRMLHHLNLIMPDHRELFSQIMLRIGAAGPETRPYRLPWFLGYRLHPGDSLLVTAMLHNPTPKEYRGIRLRVRLEVSQARPLLRPLAIRPVYLDVMPPAGVHAFDNGAAFGGRLDRKGDLGGPAQPRWPA
jgi:hypothetical protein